MSLRLSVIKKIERDIKLNVETAQDCNQIESITVPYVRYIIEDMSMPSFR